MVVRRVSLFLPLVLLARPADADVIVITSDEWCPYNCSEDNPTPGYVVEIARLVFAAAGHQVRYVVRPWARALRETVAGRCNAAIGLNDDLFQAGLIPSEATIGMMRPTFFTQPASAWRFEGLDSLRGHILGVALGYSYGSAIDRYVAENPAGVSVLHGETPFLSGLDKLRHQELDVLIEDATVAVTAASSASVTIRAAGIAAPPQPLRVGFSQSVPESRAYERIFSTGLAELRRSGKLAEILNRYGVDDWDDSSGRWSSPSR
jgi:polar amino acid transport system substrate-binding protein